MGDFFFYFFNSLDLILSFSLKKIYKISFFVFFFKNLTNERPHFDSIVRKVPIEI
jgi:hypothetical protein